MKLVLVSHPLCPYVHRAAATLHHKQIPFELRYIDLEDKPAWFTAISPRGKVPLLIADDVVLFESAVIVEFLDETHPPHIVPADPIERARQRAWIEVANDLLVAQRKLAIAATAADVAAARPGVDAVLARFDAAVRGPFFAGDAPGIVDFAVAPAAFRAAFFARHGLDLTAGHPATAAWFARLASLPAVVRAAPADFDDRYLTYLRKQAGGAPAALAA